MVIIVIIIANPTDDAQDREDSGVQTQAFQLRWVCLGCKPSFLPSLGDSGLKSKEQQKTYLRKEVCYLSEGVLLFCVASKAAFCSKSLL